MHWGKGTVEDAIDKDPEYFAHEYYTATEFLALLTAGSDWA